MLEIKKQIISTKKKKKKKKEKKKERTHLARTSLHIVEDSGVIREKYSSPNLLHGKIGVLVFDSGANIANTSLPSRTKPS